MKHLFTAAMAIGLLLQACQTDPKTTEEYKQLEGDKQALAQEGGMKDSTINEMFGAFNRVSENLRAIREKQGLLAKGGGVEGGANMEEGIVSDLRAIDSLLAENKKIIARMRKNSKEQGNKLSELEKTILELERSMGEKDVEIGALKEQLTSTNASLASMITMYQDKEQLAEMQKNELNTAYYAVGSQKELRDNGILTKEGGFIGIGKVSKLNTAGMSMEYFKKVDITQVQTIPVGTRKAKLITSHPEGSYKLVGEGKVDNISITDPAKFWSVSKYMVVQAD
ncbi:MAG TPA: hypothetical protein VGE21_06325 [Flavobacteriales bacterium]